MPTLAELNAAVGAGYDAVPYDPVPNTALDLECVGGLAALFGPLPAQPDVLDLGCGTGVQLLRAGQRTAGRIVGVDISRQACQVAAQRCSAFGPRAQVHCADLTQVDPQALGRFDVAYLVGILYVVPPAVREALLRLVTACLRPGGVFVVCYYSGGLHQMRAAIHRHLARTVPSQPFAERIRQARQALAQLAALLPPAGPGRDMGLAVLSDLQGKPDSILFHEVFNSWFEPVETLALAETLAPHGLQFLGLLPPTAQPPGETGRDRATMLDRTDFVRGDYRTAVFRRAPCADAAQGALALGLHWQAACSPVPAQEGTWQVNGTATRFQVTHPAMADMLGGMRAGPAAVTPGLVGALGADRAAADLLMLWRAGGLVPVAPGWRPA